MYSDTRSLRTGYCNGNSVVIYFDTTKLLNKTFTLNAVDSEGLFTPASMSIKLIDAV